MTIIGIAYAIKEFHKIINKTLFEDYKIEKKNISGWPLMKVRFKK